MKVVRTLLPIAVSVAYLASMVFIGFLWNPLYLTQGDFNLDFKFGVGAVNELNTFKGTFTKDMVIDPTITIRLTLSKQELSQIYQKMIDIDFFNLPETFPLSNGTRVAPSSSYYFKVENGSRTKEVTWNDNSQLDSNVENNLHELTSLIGSIIAQKLEYKILPPPRGGYL